jgi:hypothetical protein
MNRNSDPKARVFVSSVIEGFQLYRQAAREAINSAGMEAILVNEDFPSVAASSRNTCLDAVESCDWLLLLIDLRGGWKTPSGKLVIEEEYERARELKKPVLAFIRTGNPDEEAQRFAEKVSSYVEGLFRQNFSSPRELKDKIGDGLRGAMREARPSNQNQADLLSKALSEPHRITHRTTMRAALYPERQEEVLDPIRLEAEDFADSIHHMGHSQGIQLFKHELSKHKRLVLDALVIEQLSGGQKTQYTEWVRLEIRESGAVIVDTNVSHRTDRTGNDYHLMDSFVLAEEDIETCLQAALRFTGALYTQIDPYNRHQRFLLNACLAGIGHRKLVRNPTPQHRYGSNIFGIDRTLPAYNEPRVVTRTDLTNPDYEIARLMAKFRRAVEAAKSPV